MSQLYHCPQSIKTTTKEGVCHSSSTVPSQPRRPLKRVSVTAIPLSRVNQAFSFMETTTDRDNFTYINNSGDGQELKHNNESFLQLWSDLDTYKEIFWGIVLCISVIGVTGNTLVLIMMGDQKLSSLSYSVYLNFLAVSDSLLLITRVIYETEKVFFPGQLKELKLKVCFVPTTFRILSPWLVVGLTLDRYVCVCFPLTQERFCTRMKATVFCSALFGMSVVLILPFLFHIELVNGECFPSQNFKHYYIFLCLLFASSLPCLIILVFNIFIIIQIQRSNTFRTTFTRSTSNSACRQQDGSTRPLVLISVLVFVTMIPVALSEAVIAAIRLLDSDFKYLAILGNIWLICFLIYLLNFGQNFFILIGSSSNYRQIIRKRLDCFTSKWKRGNRLNNVMRKHIPGNTSCSESSVTGLSRVSAIQVT